MAQPDTTIQEFALPSDLDAKYEVLHTIGVGGMGVVLKARHRITNQTVAIKLLRRDKASSANVVIRFKQEAEAASKLSHPNVIVVHDFGASDDIAYLVMEYIEGSDLAHIIRTERLDVARLKKIFLQVCDGLAHAHRHGVIHRDLKPSNILIKRKQGEPELAKIADFGIAKLTTDETTQHLTKTGEICGSPLYMSPEQCIGQPADFRSDIFSLGCLMYEAITGQVPNAGENTLETIHRRTTEPPRSFTECGVTYPPIVEKIIMRCLARDPGERYQTVEDLRSDLESDKISARELPKRAIAKIAAGVLVLACVGYGTMTAFNYAQNTNSLEARVHAAIADAQNLMDKGNLNEARRTLIANALPQLKAMKHDKAFFTEKRNFLGTLADLEERESGKDGLQEMDTGKRLNSVANYPARTRGRASQAEKKAVRMDMTGNAIDAIDGMVPKVQPASEALQKKNESASNPEYLRIEAELGN